MVGFYVNITSKKINKIIWLHVDFLFLFLLSLLPGQRIYDLATHLWSANQVAPFSVFCQFQEALLLLDSAVGRQDSPPILGCVPSTMPQRAPARGPITAVM